MTIPPKHRLRWYQYSLRSLFVLTVLVAIGGSWFAWKKQQVEQQRAAVRWIEELGGIVWYDWEYDVRLGWLPTAEPPGPVWLRAWLGDDFFSHPVAVGLLYEPVTDAGLERLKGLTDLQELWFYNTHVTDAGLEHLHGLTRLQELDLSGTDVTDEGVKKLQEALPNCKIERRRSQANRVAS